ncbi:MAG: proteasome subunit beta [Acidimicrobiia bacterium]
MIQDPRRGGLPLVGGLPESSFTALLRSFDLPPKWEALGGEGAHISAPEATTILALRFADGVVMVGDRQATDGYSIVHKRVQKVFPADRFTAVAVSGTAGLALELVRLFQTELEHYEKLEGSRLSIEGQANHLGAMIRQHLPMAFQGLIVVPIFCGYEPLEQRGRLYAYDVVGGRYEEQDFAATGSGGREAKAYLRGSYQPEMPEDDALKVGMGALVAASEEDTATGGPDLRKGIYPNLITISGAGYQEVPEEQVARVAREVVEGTA